MADALHEARRKVVDAAREHLAAHESGDPERIAASLARLFRAVTTLETLEEIEHRSRN